MHIYILYVYEHTSIHNFEIGSQVRVKLTLQLTPNPDFTSEVLSLQAYITMFDLQDNKTCRSTIF